jgi:SAM-dependent methyltransferase
LSLQLDYVQDAETPGVRITREALAMLYTRYAFARPFCRKKAVLEVGCGTGQGLGCLSQEASYVVGGDHAEIMVSRARRHYGRRLAVLCLDAHTLPFRSATFGVVILYEALYYLGSPAQFLDECRRVLAPGGVFLLCTVNCEWPGFNPSRLAIRYFSASELMGVVSQHGFEPTLYGAPPPAPDSLRTRIENSMRRAGARLHLIPKTMKGKELLKRMFLGPLEPVPAELGTEMSGGPSPTPIGVHEAPPYKFLFVVANRR